MQHIYFNGDDTPPEWTSRPSIRNQEAVERWGEPINVEEARGRWSELVQAAASEGTITLIALDRAGPDWVALVPMSEVMEPVETLDAYGASEARPMLGTLVRLAGGYPSRTQLITHFRKPAAALVAATELLERPLRKDRLDLVKLLHEGGKVVLDFWPGTPAWNDESGGEPGEPEAYIATALDADGNKVGTGGGHSMQEALRTVTAPLAACEEQPEGAQPGHVSPQPHHGDERPASTRE
ncbi:hypothetical protein [Nonomuraea jabiensis]|uniref:hypothetical protein n=1 Tax=Nonomuraea jabiensis TaxID=882448 RepID=UPI003D73BC33